MSIKNQIRNIVTTMVLEVELFFLTKWIEHRTRSTDRLFKLPTRKQSRKAYKEYMEHKAED